MASSWGGAFRTGFGQNRGSMGGRGGFGSGFGGGFRNQFGGGGGPPGQMTSGFHVEGDGGGNQPWWQAMMPYALSALGGMWGPDAQNAKLAREKEAARQRELDEEIARRNKLAQAASAAMAERWGGG